MSVTANTTGCARGCPETGRWPSPETVARRNSAALPATCKRANACPNRGSAASASSSSTPARTPATWNETLDWPAGMVTEAGAVALPASVRRATASGASTARSTESVMGVAEPATTPAAGQALNFNARRSEVSATARSLVARR